MESTANIINKLNKYIPTGINIYKPTDINWYDNDYLYNQLTDLVNPQYRAWYCKRFYSLGKTRVLELASIARADGREPRKLFSKLIKV